MKRKSGIAALSVATAAALLATGCGEAKKIEKFFNEGEYDEAVELFENGNISDAEREKIAKNLRERLDNVIKEFGAGEISYKSARKTVSAIIEMDITSISDEAVEALSKVDELNASKEAFKTAKEYDKNDKYADAYVYYKKVIKEDGNYEEASTRISKMIELLYSNTKVEVDKYIANGSYAKAVLFCESQAKAVPEGKLEKLFEDTRAAYLEDVNKRAAEFLSKEDYDNAMSCYYEIDYLGFWSDDQRTVIDEKKAEIKEAKDYAKYANYRDQYIEKAEGFLAEENFYNAYYYLNLAKNYNEEFASKDEVYLAAEKKADDAYEAVVKGQLQPYLDAKSYLGATEVLTKAFETREVPALKTLYDDIQKSSPVYLGSLSDINIKSYASKGNIKNDPYESPLGNVYPSSSSCFELKASAGDNWSSGTSGSITFNLNGEYKTVRGVLDILGANVTAPGEAEGDPDQVASLSTATGGEEPAAPSAETGSGSGEDAGDPGTEPTGEPAQNIEWAETTDKEGYTSDESGAFYVYGEDGETVLFAKKMNGATIASTVEVDVTGLSSITVQYTSEAGDSSALLFDWVLEK